VKPCGTTIPSIVALDEYADRADITFKPVENVHSYQLLWYLSVNGGYQYFGANVVQPAEGWSKGDAKFLDNGMVYTEWENPTDSDSDWLVSVQTRCDQLPGAPLGPETNRVHFWVYAKGYKYDDGRGDK
jgi:hypothetical protein